MCVKRLFVLPFHRLWPQFIARLTVKSFACLPFAYHSFTPKNNLFSKRQLLPSSTSIQCIFCMDDYVHISHIDGQTIGSVWTTFQLNASAKARLVSPADEKSVAGENSCKVTDQRGPLGPHPWSAFSPQMNEEWSFSTNECEIDFSKVQTISLSLIYSLSRVGRMDFSRSARSTDGTWRLFLPSPCRPWSTRARPRRPSG